MKSSIAASVVLACFCTHASAQRAAAPSADAPSATTAPDSAEARAAQLKAVVGLVTTPDRELNIANFEQIMQSNDARRIEIAVRTLIASEDPILRGLAMRGYFVVYPQLTLEVELPPDEFKIVEQARADGKSIDSFGNKYRQLYLLSILKFKFDLNFFVNNISSPKGEVRYNDVYKYKFDYFVRGARTTFIIKGNQSAGECEFSLLPEKNATIVGTVKCSGSEFIAPFRVAAPMF